MIMEISDKELLKIESDDLKYFSETRIIDIPRRVVLNFFESIPIGFVTFNVRYFNRNAYITYYVRSDMRGKGYGKVILKKAIDYAFDEMNLNRLTAEVYEYNEISIYLLEKLGFVKEGVLRKAKYSQGRYFDIYVYGLLKDERR
ncbi:GCN5 family acetyltransferase [Thermosipho sp. 1063]|uniref:GNAT family N-acetyltransferase n=1 Tax=unclassified Thermosipho (in: thermotogales) TaxID=2676525 RepID=UPI0009494682|nr:MULTISPECIES: GNAT family protein [unclassified Thermosipho (in: thermotogales)]ANQ53372.1 GCN5 family acetyltransferase [Thermosipho sp. 1070]APT71821.1 GCN5 family acetyltransferase [Thermosipho sp. 1063]OOC45327.1 GCN5 family acetyltransferase [Thermosipho sp. 1074]